MQTEEESWRSPIANHLRMSPETREAFGELQASPSFPNSAKQNTHILDVRFRFSVTVKLWSTKWMAHIARRIFHIFRQQKLQFVRVESLSSAFGRPRRQEPESEPLIEFKIDPLSLKFTSWAATLYYSTVIAGVGGSVSHVDRFEWHRTSSIERGESNE